MGLGLRRTRSLRSFSNIIGVYWAWPVQVALLTTFTASKKEPLVTMANRVREAFLRAGLGEPSIRFNLGDALVPGFVSSVDRVLKRYP